MKLAAKRDIEMEAESSRKQKAAEELANWTKQKEVKLQAKKDSNRSEEAVVVESVVAGIEGGHPWERVMKLIDANAEAAESGKADVSRMRKLFIQLKNDKN